MKYDTFKQSFIAGEALAADRLVKLGSSAKEVVYADEGEAAIGVTDEAAVEDGTVHVRCFFHTFEMVASEAIGYGGQVHGQDDGKIGAALTGEETGLVALEAATANNDVIQVGVLWPRPAKRLITDDTATVTLSASQMGTVHTVLDLGYAGAAALAIPASTSVLGSLLTVEKTGSAGAITITPATGNIGGSGTHAALDAQYDIATFLATATEWVLVHSVIA